MSPCRPLSASEEQIQRRITAAVEGITDPKERAVLSRIINEGALIGRLVGMLAATSDWLKLLERRMVRERNHDIKRLRALIEAIDEERRMFEGKGAQ